MNINVISSYKSLLTLEKEWKYIFEKSGTDNIFTSWEWCSLWCKHFAKKQELIILTVKDGGEVVGIAPFIITKGELSALRGPAISFVGGSISDYMDFLILRNNKEVAGRIVDFLIKQNHWARIEFKRIPQSSPNLAAIKEHISGLEHPYLSRVNCVSPVVRIDGGWDNYSKSISKGLKQDIRTAHNKFKLIGEITLEACDENTLKPLLDALFEIHKKRQAYKIGQSLFDSQEHRDFFNDLAATFTRLGWADITALKINDRVISVVFAFKYKGTFFYWIPAFDPEFIKFSPSKIHIHALIKKCFEYGYEKFDFMRGDEAYKTKWFTTNLNNYEIKIYMNRLYRTLDVVESSVKNRIKDLYNRHPLLKRMLIRISKVN